MPERVLVRAVYYDLDCKGDVVERQKAILPKKIYVGPISGDTAKASQGTKRE
jgi:hypothetical protein